MIGSNLQNVTRAISLVKNYANQVIEASVIEYVCGKIEKQFIYQEELAALREKVVQLKKANNPITVWLNKLKEGADDFMNE